jgi:hypothetical protein
MIEKCLNAIKSQEKLNQAILSHGINNPGLLRNMLELNSNIMQLVFEMLQNQFEK